jgi:hypothetical protein
VSNSSSPHPSTVAENGQAIISQKDRAATAQ